MSFNLKFRANSYEWLLGSEDAESGLTILAQYVDDMLLSVWQDDGIVFFVWIDLLRHYYHWSFVPDVCRFTKRGLAFFYRLIAIM